ncbi:MAG: M14 metallopeptidase family protein [Chitinophagaceae bacterium]
MKKIMPVLLLLVNGSVFAQVPSPASFLGYEPGSHFTPHYKIVQYFEAVAKATPATMKLEQYGTTNAGRPLLLSYISSAENISNLETIRHNNLRIAGLENGAQDMPNARAIVWLSYNVHGNEPSSSEAAMVTLYELVTGNTTKASEWLKNTVVIIDPCVNPDGRDRYVNWYNSVVGENPNPDPQSQEHSEPWPQGRTNQYHFDLNRDWAWQTQVETQQRIKKYNMWMPHIHCDYHEQGFNEPYYFAPAAEPFHEVITPWQREFQTNLGRHHARYFDANHWLYFTRERFDLLYPSYGDTWPTYNGSIGVTYEQGGHSKSGLAIINEDGDTLTLKDRLMHHFTTGISTVEMASLNEAKLVENFKKFFDNAKADGVGDYKTFVVKGKGNEGKIKILKELLTRNGIDFGYANAGTANGYNYFTTKTGSFNTEAGDLVINTTQPRGALVKVLFEPKSKVSDSATYDITAWAIPYAYGIQSYAVKEKLGSVADYVTPLLTAINKGEVYGFIKPWESLDDVRFLTAMMKKGIKVRQTAKATEVNGRKYPPGSLIIIRTSNQGIADFQRVVVDAAAKLNVRLDVVGTGFMDKGADFGSPDVTTLLAPKIACLTGDYVGSSSAGEVLFYFEKEVNYPVTMIDLDDARKIDWKRFDVLVVPDGSYKNMFAKDGAIKTWVQQGGRIVVMENAVNQLAAADWGLKQKNIDDEDKNKEKPGYEDIKKYAESEHDELKSSNPGSIFKLEMDNTHPLAYGYPEFYYTLKQGTDVFEFLKDGWNVGVIKKDNQVAGFTGVKAREKLTDGTLIGQMNVGRGSVVFLAEDPLFRSFWQNGKLLFANAVFVVGQGGGFHL